VRKRSMSSSFVLVAVVVFSSVIFAQIEKKSEGVETQAKTPIPDLSGVWLGPGPKGGYAFTDGTPPMQPWAEENFKANKYPGTAPNSRGRAERDPALAYCFPPGPGWLSTIPIPFEIIQIPGRVIMYYQWDHWVRQIWMDGRGHPKDPDPTWMGHSIGSWDGDTLIVDTVGLNDKAWLDAAGHVRSDALRIVERLRRVDHATLVDEVTIDDPKAYTKPWTGQRIFTLRPDWEITEQVGCEDRLLHAAGAH
jgi:hypothetical protein